MENHNIKRLIRLSDEYEAYTLKNRREIHKNPELSFQFRRKMTWSFALSVKISCMPADTMSIPQTF